MLAFSVSFPVAWRDLFQQELKERHESEALECHLGALLQHSSWQACTHRVASESPGSSAHAPLATRPAALSCGRSQAAQPLADTYLREAHAHISSFATS